MVDRNKESSIEMSLNRRELLKKSAITGGVVWGISGVGSASGEVSGSALLESETVQSISTAVPGMELHSKDIEVTAQSPDGNGKAIRVQTNKGTLYANKLPNGKIIAIFQFPNDTPGELTIDAKAPPRSEAMLIGSPDGAQLVRTAGVEERAQILQILDLPDLDHIQISKYSDEEVFSVYQMEYENNRIEKTVVRYRGGSAVESETSTNGFEVISSSVLTDGRDLNNPAIRANCDCGVLMADVALCIQGLGSCKAALACVGGGPALVVGCAVASGCIYTIINEMFISDMPGCVNLGQDIWDGCASHCIPDL